MTLSEPMPSHLDHEGQISVKIESKYHTFRFQMESRLQNLMMTVILHQTQPHKGNIYPMSGKFLIPMYAMWHKKNNVIICSTHLGKDCFKSQGRNQGTRGSGEVWNSNLSAMENMSV